MIILNIEYLININTENYISIDTGIIKQTTFGMKCFPAFYCSIVTQATGSFFIYGQKVTAQKSKSTWVPDVNFMISDP